MRELGPTLVTGATGQVGRRLVSALLSMGQPVTVLTRHPGRALELWGGQDIRVRRGDLTEPEGLKGLGEGIATVFHLASHRPHPAEPDLYNAPDHWRVSAEGTAHLLAALADSGIERLVYVSSVRADPRPGGSPRRLTDGRVDDRAEGPPDCLYGRAKRAAEQQVLAFAQARRIKGAVLRLPMVYGLDGAGNLERLVRAIAAGRFPPWPRLAQRRSAIHVEDAIAALLLIAGHPDAGGRVYVATDGRAYSTRWIYEETLRALGRPIPRWTVPLWLLRLGATGGTLAEQVFKRRMPLTLETLAKLTEDAWYEDDGLKALGFAARWDLGSEIRRLVRRLGPASAP